MSTDQSTSSDGQKPDKDQLEAEIAATREQLGETVEQLTAKLDVKGRTKARISETTERAKEQVGVAQQRAKEQLGVAQSRAADLSRQAKDAATTSEGKPKPAVSGGAAAAVAVALAVVVLLWRRRR